MSKKFKSQASSGRAAFGGGVGGGGGGGFGGFGTSSFATYSSPLSYVAEPPDVSAISNANIGVAFKNLTKKDSTTKAKALEDLQTFVSSPSEEIEEAVLEAWVRSFTAVRRHPNSNTSQSRSSYTLVSPLTIPAVSAN